MTQNKQSAPAAKAALDATGAAKPGQPTVQAATKPGQPAEPVQPRPGPKGTKTSSSHFREE